MAAADKFVIRGYLLWPDGQIRPGELLIEEGKIRSIANRQHEELSQDFQLLTLPPASLVAPGFIDLQIHGAFGHDFTTSPQQMTAVARNLPRFGVTAFLPSLISAPLEQYAEAVRVAREARTEPGTATVLGLHVEGPYLNQAKAGAHPVHLMRLPELDELVYFDADVVRLITLAPELPGSREFIQTLVERGTVVGLGHSDASYEEASAAVEAGASWGAHLFNSMAPLLHRYPGIVGRLLADGEVRLGLVADGIHVHPAILSLVASAKGPGGVCLTSNAIAGAAMSPGEYKLGPQTVVTDAQGARLRNGTLAGGLQMLDQAVRNMVKLAGRPVAEALQMVSDTPAAVLGLETKGKLAPQYDADLVVLDRDLKVILTMIRGQVVYRTNN